ncbi:TlpA family protein disulfide reductase [Burkholderia sp. Ac-20379]|uniref:TlpA family protein disulfide reductase n=1 Tax=Burkholderia sp. Ac-20379 TaxID=2703900 RepID=UPI001F11FDD5|nr:TlpA family protein disulfide reductase [Burkholderia sp. Ac-20379]
MPYDIEASDWLNTDAPLSLPALRGRVVAVTVFQMLCPGCAHTSLPQANKLHAVFARQDLVVIGLHSVFEHHAAMTPEALCAFAGEYRLRFPIAIDLARPHSPVPATMAKWALQGTPSLLVFGRDGALALQHFGHLEDLRLGAVLGELIAQRGGMEAAADAPAPSASSIPTALAKESCHENCRV